MDSHAEQSGWGRAALSHKIDLTSNSLSELGNNVASRIFSGRKAIKKETKQYKD
jgi:hypothetical protein